MENMICSVNATWSPLGTHLRESPKNEKKGFTDTDICLLRQLKDAFDLNLL